MGLPTILTQLTNTCLEEILSKIEEVKLDTEFIKEKVFENNSSKEDFKVEKNVSF